MSKLLDGLKRYIDDRGVVSRLKFVDCIGLLPANSQLYSDVPVWLEDDRLRFGIRFSYDEFGNKQSEFLALGTIDSVSSARIINGKPYVDVEKYGARFLRPGNEEYEGYVQRLNKITQSKRDAHPLSIS